MVSALTVLSSIEYYKYTVVSKLHCSSEEGIMATHRSKLSFGTEQFVQAENVLE